MPHASVYIDLLSCLVPFCVRAMTISLGSCTIHTYIHTILPSRSFTTSFVFPSFPVPAKTIETHFRKKLTCGVIRSFNGLFVVLKFPEILYLADIFDHVCQSYQGLIMISNPRDFQAFLKEVVSALSLFGYLLCRT